MLSRTAMCRFLPRQPPMPDPHSTRRIGCSNNRTGFDAADTAHGRYGSIDLPAEGFTMRRNPAVFAILVGGMVAATLDITYAISFSAWRGVPPTRLLQSVASGLLGSASYEGGTATAVLGLILHYLMALLIAAIFY